MMKSILTILLSLILVVSGSAQTRNVAVGTNGAVVQPTNFWSADVTNARSGLGLGSAATNPTSAFQPASTILSNLASSNGIGITNISVNGIIGGLSTNGNAISLTNFPSLLLRTNGDGSGITNISGANVVGAVAAASNITGAIAISNVSSLQSSLDAKLGTNPTLFIANISNLQTTLDGKLGTNPTLQISNIAALQTALDGKLSGTFPIAISNVSGLQTSLDAKLATNPTLAIANITGLQTDLDSKLSITGNAVNLTNFPTSLLRVDGSAAALTNFPASLLRITGDASGLTNFPTLNQNTTGSASNVTGIVAITNGGSGANTASGARTAFGLGTAATNPASAFQPSSTILTDLSSSNGGGLTNIAASSLVGTVALASNITGTAALATNVTGVVALVNGGTGATNATGAKTALGIGPSDVFVGLTNLGTGTGQGFSSSPYILGSTNSTAPNNAVLALGAAGVRSVAGLTLAALTNTNNASFRSAIELGSSATNPASAFQPSSSVLSNLASSNGIDITNIRATNIVGASFSLTASALTGLSSNNAINLTNVQASNIVGTIATTNLPSISFSNAVQSFVSDVSSATNTVTNSRNVTVYSISPTVNLITNTVQLPTSNAIAGDLARIIHTGPTNSMTRVRKIGEATNLITLNQASEAAGFIYDGTNWLVLPNNSQTAPIYFSGTNAVANTATSRTNLGLGATWLTNTNVTNFRTAIGLGTNDNPVFNGATIDGDLFAQSLETASGTNSTIVASDGIEFAGVAAATTRTNLGLGWSALTNSNAGTSLVSVDSNGSVVSPTNFWQAAPIASNLQTIVQTFTPTTNSTNAATNGRNVYVYSLSTNVSGITNTITLPTNAATIAGDNITVTHQGLTNSTTAIRRLGETNNLITINNFDEAVKFIYENGAWAFYHNISFVEPIRFSGTNATANAAASRTNLGVSSSFGSGSNSVIGGGLSNNASGIGATVSGGVGNAAGGEYSAVAGGSNNSADSYGFVGGGYNNSVFVLASVIGGNGNNASGQSSSIMGGGINTASGLHSSIMGSVFSSASGSNSVVIGGNFSLASGHYSVAIGRSSSAGHNNSFVWSDGQGFSSTNTNSFNVSARGGMSLDLGTNGIIFRTNASADATRNNLGLGATWLTNTNVTNFRTAIGLGDTNDVIFRKISVNSSSVSNNPEIHLNNFGGSGYNVKALYDFTGNYTFEINGPDQTILTIKDNSDTITLGTNIALVFNGNGAAQTRNGLGLGATNQVTFGRLYISNTNVGAFEGLANLINSNNTTISNETLFRVGLAEATNRSAQFGFRVARTNNGGEGFATFSVYGYNALMMIGPSDRSRTNTNAGAGIEADIYSISETNKVATLIDTNTGAFTLHRPIGFRTNETNNSPAAGNAYADRAGWLQIYVGTNTFYIPLFQ